MASGMTDIGRTHVLRVASVWGTTILDVKMLDRGEGYLLADPANPRMGIIPDGITISPEPIRAVPGGWELDARGALAGLLKLRGRDEDPVALASHGAPIPVVPGDYGLLQYGLLSIFFQYTTPAQPIGTRNMSIEVLGALALFSSAVMHVGILGLVKALSTPPDIPPPLELLSPEDLAKRFKFERATVEEEKPQAATAASQAGGSGVKNPGAQDKKPQGGGRKMPGQEGKLGLNGAAARNEMPGPPRPSTDLGSDNPVFDAAEAQDIRQKLQSLQTVSDALGGLGGNDLVRGPNSGRGLVGGGSGGGGNGPGVPYAGGNLDTGWGPGMGGGYGFGTGGPGGAGNGGFGRGGSGGGNGTGNGNGNGNGNGGGEPGERGVAGNEPDRAPNRLTPAQVQRVVQMHLGAVRACFELEARNNPGFKGGVTIGWSIAPDGHVAGASVAGNSSGSARAANCVLNRVREWHFPSSEGTTNTSYPFVYVGSK